MKASDYAGKYWVKEAKNTVADVEGVVVGDDLSRGDVIDITTDGFDETTANVTITSETGTVIIEDAVFILSSEFGCLRGDNLEAEGQKLKGHVMLISRYDEQTTQGEYKAIYGAVIKKDPDSVGAWGADDIPPPDPDSATS